MLLTACKRLREEGGYSLVEVMVSILIMAIAILPMMGMFDMGLQGASTGSNYDRARMLANVKLEQAKNLPFEQIKNNFPESVGTTTYNGSGSYLSAWKTEPGDDFVNLQYRVEKQYMAQPSTAPASASEAFGTSSTATDLIRVTVTVRWPDGNQYTTLGLVTR